MVALRNVHVPFVSYTLLHAPIVEGSTVGVVAVIQPESQTEGWALFFDLKLFIEEVYFDKKNSIDITWIQNIIRLQMWQVVAKPTQTWIL